MAKKRVNAVIKLQVPAGQATPAPPVGPALGPHGVSAPQFVQQFNDRTKSEEPGLTVPVVITVFADRTFSFDIKTTAGRGPDQEGDRSREGVAGVEPHQGRRDQSCRARGNRGAQDAGSQRQ